MSALPYFPFATPRYEMKIGAVPLGPTDRIFERGTNFAEEMALKRACLAYDARYYCQALPGSEAAQAEVAALVGAVGAGIAAAGDCVQEDLLLLDAQQPGLPLVAGHLCFANAWCLDEKIGKPFLAIHGPVPGFASSIGPGSEKLLMRLQPGRAVSRLNWAVKSSGQLDLTSRWDEQVREWNALVDADNAGERCWMRVERQTLSRLPQSEAILFTVRTYTAPVAQLAVEQRELLRGVLQSCPEEMLRYKGILAFAAPLLRYLSLQ
ncbi:heme-dependent oxidative N-demethylase family protein [Bryobacter aggregatus]|uniref:heme-dependent oxidative N-demethylase family protein n=1 Tax=Bryobacter aggregatus TaxID=360054 RepID=UPI0004E0D8D1|nr:DUF3445 domain-containing protein [Bryobacter aggregatus]